MFYLKQTFPPVFPFKFCDEKENLSFIFFITRNQFPNISNSESWALCRLGDKPNNRI